MAVKERPADPFFEVRARVRLSERGRSVFRLTPDRRGTVTAISKTGMAFRIKWDSTKDADYVHGTLLVIEDRS